MFNKEPFFQIVSIGVVESIDVEPADLKGGYKVGKRLSR